ncbi:ring-cleaving dioxygenase [Paenibacillus radicis (ex Xue et al. 2023)]|uniref:Ring-cleaving dioxygenase n=1 Tax=Paenibacillus radicis (ex Xue et al. 2023) TaxID=2972489 RepID=A0ABT1YBN8_9BACL|nr:ring-cleaving dioxygenase [Paenibacillus radicis (ex Xue et al. 2023)]MCR8630602.1 ring-cleaving dioxygenase [Paenibacillus radicis (ex Xue et al. 2023)]
MHTISGHHHISMLTKNAQKNNQFYQKVLGLRRVKKTVNQDNPEMYHLFYGDLTGSAGTELSFFEMPKVGSTVRGTNAITQIGLLVPSYESLVFWKNRFESLDVQHGEITRYADRDALHFEDSEGLRMILLNNNGEVVPENWSGWEDSVVELQHRILGMGTVEITVRNLDRLANTLKDMFGYTEASRFDTEAVYQSVAGQSFGEIVIKQVEGPSEKPGKGSIHHLAIRVKNEDELRYWDEIVKARGFQSTGVVDRFYFQSLYFRESNGILFEIATDGPGFTTDSTVDALGKALDLPPFLEERRAEIEGKLIPLD